MTINAAEYYFACVPCEKEKENERIFDNDSDTADIVDIVVAVDTGAATAATATDDDAIAAVVALSLFPCSSPTKFCCCHYCSLYTMSNDRRIRRNAQKYKKKNTKKKHKVK